MQWGENLAQGREEKGEQGRGFHGKPIRRVHLAHKKYKEKQQESLKSKEPISET